MTSVCSTSSGRVEVMRARLAMKTGNADAATERYRRAMSVARQLKSIELRTRVLVGRAIMARLGGNNPRARTLARSAATTAERAGHDRLASVAHVTSMVIEAASGRFDEAVLHGWRGYTLATGDAVLQSEILANLGQLFLEAGHPQTALSAFRAVLAARVGPRIELLVLGGMALASAFVGQRIAVDEIDAAIMRFADVHAPPHDVASSMLELARARQWLGETASADRLRRRSLQLAERYGYHEIAHNAAAEFSAPEPSRNLSPRVETVAHAVRELVNA